MSIKATNDSFRLRKRCFGPCGSPAEPLDLFDRRPNSRLCTAPNCLHAGWAEDWHPKLVTFLPEWHDSLDVNILPEMRSSTRADLFAHWADSAADFPVIPTPGKVKKVKYKPAKLQDFLPYRTDSLRAHGLYCGSPLCYRSKRLQSWIWHKNVFVLDLSTYLWSHTLKDPRSWAILNVALENKIRHLAVWTAGNAGLSLAMLVRTYNHFLKPPERIRVYTLYSRLDRNFDSRVRGGLRNWECQLIPVPSPEEMIVPPNKIQEAVRNRVIGLEGKWDSNDYWEVTDGWDAVGMLMYRLLTAQVIRDLQPTHIIAPIGTGNLILGILLGVKDCRSAGVPAGSDVHVIGVIPTGENIVSQIVDTKESSPRWYSPHGAPSGGVPLMPKIAGTYTPLLACIDHALTEGKLTYFATDDEDQELAVGTLFGCAAGRRIIGEPSSTSSFAALPRVAHSVLNRQPDERVLVINTGLGLLSTAEQQFLSRHCM